MEKAVGLKAGKPSEGKQQKMLSDIADEKKMARFTCDLEVDLHKALKVQAAEEGRRAVDIVRDALAAYLGDKGKKV